MNEYVATFKTSRQISPDDWEVYNPALKVTNETTIGQISEWAKTFGETQLEVKIIELQTPQP